MTTHITVGRGRDLYGTVSQPRLAMALAAVEASLRSSKAETYEVPAGLSIEHLIPQGWRKHWPITGPDGRRLRGNALESAAAPRDARLHRLGNLTIVAGPLNSGMSNSPWETKREELNQHTVLLLNARIAKRKQWNEQAVDEHGQWLAERLAAIWPGPDRHDWA